MKRRLFVVLVAIPLACAAVDPFPDLADTPPLPPPTDAGTDVRDSAVAMEAETAPPSGCMPGETRACGFETCTGVERCTSSRMWSACDARDASIELCATAVDESCDGIGACTGDGRWAIAVANPLEQHATGVAVDAAGDAYVVGWFLGDLTIGALVVPQAGSASLADGFVVKIARSGAPVWAKAVADTKLTAIAAGAGGGVVVGGNVLAASDSGECGALASLGFSTVLATRWSPAGTCTAAKTYGVGMVASIAVDPGTDDVILGGPYNDDLAFGGTAEVLHETTTPGFASGYLARLDPLLVGRSALSIDTARLSIRAVAASADGHAAVTGLGGDVFDLGGTGVFLATFDRMGMRTGAARLKADSNGDPDALGYGPDNRLYVAGAFAKTMDLSARGGPVLTAVSPGAVTDVFLVRAATPDLAVLEGVRYGDVGLERPKRLAVDADQNVLLAGWLVAGDTISQPVTLGGATFPARLKSDVFVAKYDRTLAHVWSHHFAGDQSASATAVAASPLGDVVVAGDVEGALDLDGGTGDAGDGGPVATDVFVLMRRP